MPDAADGFLSLPINLLDVLVCLLLDLLRSRARPRTFRRCARKARAERARSRAERATRAERAQAVLMLSVIFKRSYQPSPTGP